jgi:Ca2+-binding RTX toxin-like protein
LGTTNSFTAAAVTVSGTLGDQATISAATTTIGKTIASSNYTVGAGVGTSGAYVALPTLEVGATTGTIGSTTINAGVASFVSQSIGSTTTPASVGAITAQGSGNVKVTLGNTTAATVTSGASAVGAISAAAMTSPTSIFTVDASASARAALTITGSAGPDVVTLNNAAVNDTITGGNGADVITLGATGGAAGGSDVVVMSVGSSNAVVVTGNANDTGSDTIYAFGPDGATDKIRINITTADTAWDITTHVLVGAAGGTTPIGAAATYVAGVYLVQVGNPATDTDGFDIAANVYSTVAGGLDTVSFSDNAEAQAGTIVNLTGTSGNDTLVTGANNDSINGGAGNDNITGGAGADSLTGGGGNDTFVLTTTSSVASSSAVVTNGASATLVDDGDTFTFATGIAFSTGTGVDVITDFNTGDLLDVNTSGTTYINLNGTTASTNLVLNSHYYLQGTFVASTGVFTVNSAATASTTNVALLVVADGIANTLANQTGVVILTGVVATDLTSASFI